MKIPRDELGLAHLDHGFTTVSSLSILCFGDRDQPKHACVIRIHGMCRVLGGPVRGERQLKARVGTGAKTSRVFREQTTANCNNRGEGCFGIPFYFGLSSQLHILSKMYSECILIPANFKCKETRVYYNFLDICADLSYL